MFCRRITPQKFIKGRTRCAAKLIDRLIGIADGKNVGLVPGQQISQLDLPQIGILKFVNQQEAGAALFALPPLGVRAQQPHRVADHVPKGAQPLSAQQIFHRMESRGNLAAALDGFIARERWG